VEEKLVFDNTIYRVRHGSMAYGTNIAGSDIDEKGICILPDPSYYYGFKRFEQKDGEWEDGNDRVIYDIRKFVKLALECNPSIIEILFVDEADILYIDDMGQQLRDSRDMFLSKQAARKFSGYAFSQLHRIKNHKVWQDGELEEPKPEDFVKVTQLTTDSKKFTIELDNHMFAVNPPKTLLTNDADISVAIEHFDKHGLRVANKRYGQYLRYMKHRNPKRAKLEEQFGYDTKHGMHLIRLLRMGVELIRDGNVIVRRPDKDELLAIRNGEVSYDKLVEEADRLDAELKTAIPNSPLPEEPDYKKAQELLVKLVKEKLGN